MATIRKRKDGAEPMPMAPMIDMVFLLLVFFMTVSAVAKANKVIELELPKSTASTVSNEKSRRAVVSIDAEGSLFVHSKAMDINGLRSYFSALAQQESVSEVLIRTAEDLEYSHVERVTRLCAESGIHDIAFSTYLAKR